MVEYADDPRTELDRKAQQLQWVALIETVSYGLLFLFWAVLHSPVGTKLMGFFHGWIFLAFAAMVIFIARPMRWRWPFVAVALLTGPIGSILVYERIRRDGAPPTRALAVKLTASHIFGAPVAAVCEGMGDPDFYAQLLLPDLEPPELLVRTVKGDRIDIHTRFTYTGKLDPIARRIVGHDHVAWVQRLVIDAPAHSASLTVSPEVGVMPVTCSGTFTLHEADGAQCLRTLEAELKIKVPIIGSRAEKSLAPGIMRRLDLEAEALNQYLAS